MTPPAEVVSINHFILFGISVMRCKSFILSLFIFLAVVSSPARADLTPAILAPSSDVKDIISHFRAEMSALIAQAGGEARVTLMRAFQLSDQLIQSLTTAYADSVNLTFGALDKQQQKAFSDTLSAINEMGKAVRDPVGKGLQLGNTFAAITADVFSWTKKPMVIAYSPSYVAPSSISDTVRIAISGVRLHATGVAAPKLRIKNTDFAPSELTDVSIGFVVPRTVFSEPTKGTGFETGTLTIFRPSGSWIGGQPEQIYFSFLFTVLPNQLGSYTVNTIAIEKKKEEKLLKTEPLSATKNGGGGDVTKECYPPESGYVFDLLRVKTIEDKHTAYKDDDTSPGTNFGKVQIDEGVKTEKKICISVSATTGCTECGAHTEGHLEAWMVRTVDEEKPLTDGPNLLKWEEDPQPIRLKDQAISQIITVRLFDEITRRLPATSRQSLQFLTIEPDPRNNVVFLAPQREWNAR
ncbi:hypothetical protein QA639_28820 [Bradyrhizobium pachyrhizi]|uniref:hypothetical protein n=1 Tax=Bradyrhizobium pachyrhizi TaxID=280333 RepID=UPI0024B0A49C|nr:hypothetical protein [Bradyrhizobium pachyrhizi]WFU53644.1 hypothetical protein QA639_28820 [Bradyrhizobium pachyrhizi]